jgi:hypothetical protein
MVRQGQGWASYDARGGQADFCLFQAGFHCYIIVPLSFQ